MLSISKKLSIYRILTAMHIKVICLSALLISSISLLSCSSGQDIHSYTSPIITGQVLDKTTDEPLSNVSIYENSIHQTKTDVNGYFKLPAFKFSYTTSDYDVRSLNEASSGSFSIGKKGYKGIIYNKSGIKKLEVKHAPEVPYHIHLGKVFLEPLPEGVDMNDIEDEYVAKMIFCQPNESQKDVNCMPLPDGFTNEAL